MVEICFNDRIILGLIEEVTIKGPKGEKTVLARIDTGATMCSIDDSLVEELELGPVIREKKVKQSTGITNRPVINVNCTLKGKDLTGEFTVADREHMKYQVLIGKNLLQEGFLIDPNESGAN